MTTVSYKIHCLAANNLPTPQHMSLMSPHTPPSSEETKYPTFIIIPIYPKIIDEVIPNADIFDGDVN